MAYFDQIVYMNGPHFLTNDMRNNIFFVGRGFAEHQTGRRGQLAKMLLTLEPHGTVYFIKLCLLMHFKKQCLSTYMLNGEEALPSISSALLRYLSDNAHKSNKMPHAYTF